ncbi:hypothetical protein L7F22_067920 [Adiantum nelumboides]|nr:hypothetical protein [Adiantum nelumboides]
MLSLHGSRYALDRRGASAFLGGAAEAGEGVRKRLSSLFDITSDVGTTDESESVQQLPSALSAGEKVMVQFLEDVAMRETAHNSHAQMHSNGAPPPYASLVPGWAGRDCIKDDFVYASSPAPQTCNIVRPTPIIPTSPIYMMDLWGGVSEYSLPASSCSSPPPLFFKSSEHSAFQHANWAYCTNRAYLILS